MTVHPKERSHPVSRTNPVTWAKVMAGTAVLALSLAACGSDDSSTPSAQDTNERL